MGSSQTFFHLGFNGVDDMFSTLLVGRCEAAGQHASILHKLLCQRVARVRSAASTPRVCATNAALQLVHEVRQRARVRDCPGVHFFLRAPKAEVRETAQFGSSGFCDPRRRPPVGIPSPTPRRHWQQARLGLSKQ